MRTNAAAPWQRALLAKSKALSGTLYKHLRLRICALEPRPHPPLTNDLRIMRQEHFMTDRALRAAMQESVTWDEREMKRRQALGDVCYQVRVGERCAHYSWVTHRKRTDTDIGLEATLNDKNVWIYDCYTTPSHRGHSMYPRVLTKILEDVRRRQGERAWIDVDESNVSSVKGITHAGFVDVARLEKTLLFSRFVLNHRKTILHAPLGKLLDQMPCLFR